MTRYFISGVSDELADRLEQVDQDEIISALERIADEHEQEEVDELASYSSVKEIKQDDDLDPVKRKQMILKARRRSDIPNRK